MASTVGSMREQEQSLRDVIAKLKDRIEAESLKSKEYGGKLKTALEQLQEECSAHDDTKVTPPNITTKSKCFVFGLCYVCFDLHCKFLLEY